ncbi:LysR substrate-binding domain-containing protein [Dyella sp.]|uniref:LysR substrate-binding domain-containing protein n=1 Tax=Dyella sp. TaxID=1869338 RepID=UPI002ED423D6
MRRKIPPLNALKVFEIAGSLCNFTRAAIALNVTQSAVSRQVRHLETQLGETLMVRRHHRLELTDAGRALLNAVQQSFDRIELTVRDIREHRHLNRLRVNAPPMFTNRWLMPRLPHFRNIHPGVEITLTAFPEDGLPHANAIDCSIRCGGGDWDGLDCVMLMHEQRIAVCSPSLLDGRDADSFDIRRIPLLHELRNDIRKTRSWPLWLDTAGIRSVDLDSGYEFDEPDMAIQAAVGGLGAAIVDRHMVQRELREGLLRQMLDIQVPSYDAYWLVTRRDQTHADALVAFQKWMLAESMQTTEKPPKLRIASLASRSRSTSRRA